MNHVVVRETAHHLGDGIGLADMGQKLITQSLALGSARHQSGDIDELDRGRYDFLGFDDGGQGLQTWIGTSTIPTLGSMVQNG